MPGDSADRGLGKGRKRLSRAYPLLGLTTAVLASLLVILSPVSGASPAFMQKIVPPFHGDQTNWSWVSSAGSAGGNVPTASYFNMSTGKGGFGLSVWANTKHMHFDGINNTSSSGGGGYVGINVKFPFNNLSGTRTLSTVTMHLTFSARGQVTMVPGSCPYVSSTGLNNTCLESSFAQTTWNSASLTYVGGGPSTGGSCSMSQGATTIGQCPSINDASGGEIQNTSTGAYGWWSGTNGTTSINTGLWNITLQFQLVKPLAKSKTLDIGFDFYSYIGTEFLESPAGAGGMPGAHGSVSLLQAMHVTSIVES